MPTISAYTSEELKRKIDRIVREEGRNQAQVGSTALALYAALPAASRRAFLELQAVEEGEGAVDGEAHENLLDRVMADVARVLLKWKWELLSERIAEEGRVGSQLPADEMGEEEIADLAVKLTSEGSRRRRRAG